MDVTITPTSSSAAAATSPPARPPVSYGSICPSAALLHPFGTADHPGITQLPTRKANSGPDVMRAVKLMAFLLASAIAAGQAATSGRGATPNIVIVLVDDLGESGIADNNPHIQGRRVSELKAEGVYLSRHYVYKFCSPTRGSFLSGRYPFRCVSDTVCSGIPTICARAWR